VDPALETREERLANRFSRRKGLEPPVDVLAVARSLADVREEEFPLEDIDGLSLNLKRPGTVPEIWINRARSYHRKRFTLAHEIGHVVIPWHTGSIVDDLDIDQGMGRDAYRRIEGQANRFATELLMPRAWAEQICVRAEHLRDGMHAIQQIADVSFQAAALRTAQVGPPGYLIAAVRDGIVAWAAKTRGTRARPPLEGVHASSIDMPAFNLPETLGSPSAEYYFWRELPGVSPDKRPAEPWREILERMLTNIPVENRFRTRQRLNAIVGNAFGRAPKDASADVLYQRVLEVLQNRSDRDRSLADVLRHPELKQYVLARIFERSGGQG
jgi:Zn-dependent peptidase ImmA (M78 family)